MKKLLMLITAIAVMFGGLAFMAPAANADNVEKVSSVSKAQSKKAKKCAKSTADTNAGGLTVLTTMVCIKADISKEMKCLAEAMKDEPVAPPRDPRAECKGKVVVIIKASIVTPPCPPGFFGGQAWLKIQIRQSVKVHALAVSIANGHVETMASFYIKVKDKVRGWSQSSCVEIPPPGCTENCPLPPCTEKCEPPKEDTPPEMTCTGMEHVFVGEDRSAFDFDSSDADGDSTSFGEPIITGPISVVTVERSGNRLTVWIVAQDIPEGTSQHASVRVVATAGGKSVGCTVNTTVENDNTAW